MWSLSCTNNAGNQEAEVNFNSVKNESSAWGHASRSDLCSNALCCCTHYLNELSNYIKYSTAILLYYLYELIKQKNGVYKGKHCFHLFWNSNQLHLTVFLWANKKQKWLCFMATTYCGGKNTVAWPWDRSLLMRSRWVIEMKRTVAVREGLLKTCF